MSSNTGIKTTHVTNETGKLLAEYSYNAWGRLRDPETLQAYPAGFENPQGFALTNGRGYTGHEHLTHFGIINMNGRLYDPVLGRMLSPDNYVQAPDFTQNFNRYSYVLNNPLKYTDPSGEYFWLMPSISYGNGSGLSIGLTFGVGVPGVIGANISAGYKFSNNDPYVSLGANVYAFNASVTYTPATGFTYGAGVGLSPGSLPYVSTNMNTAGIYYNSKSEQWGGNFSYFSYGSNGINFDFNVSLQYTYFFGRIYVENTVLADQENPYVKQKDKNCVAACGESATNSYITQDEIRNNLPEDDKGALLDGDVVEYIQDNICGYATPQKSTIFNLAIPEQEMNKGTRIFINTNTTPRHEVLLNRIIQRDIYTINGKHKTKILYYVMDPARGQYVKILYNAIKNSNIWYLYP